MSRSLPPAASLEWLKKTAKQRLAKERAKEPAKERTCAPQTQLADIHFEIAREYGFASWRSLKQVLGGTGDSPARRLMRAVGSGDSDSVNRILTESPDLVNAIAPHPYWGGGCQAMHVAVDTNRPDMVALLIERGANVNGDNAHYDHWSPLMLAAHHRRDEIVSLLLDANATRGVLECLLLGDDDALKRSLQLGVNNLPHQKPSGSILALARTPFAVEALLALKISIEGTDRWGSDVVDSLSRLGERGTPLLKLLSAHGLHLNAVALAHTGDLDSLKTLHASDPDGIDTAAAFAAACDFGHLETIRWLLEQGADVNARVSFAGRGGATALHSAAFNGDLELAKLLVEAGADISCRDYEYNNTPKGWAETALVITNNPRCQELADYLGAISAAD